jgi:regulation of enolase protein 1 (concanavalin A-like superfamily)
MNALLVRTPFRCLRGFWSSLIVIAGLGLLSAAQAQQGLYSNTYSFSRSESGFGRVVAVTGETILVGYGDGEAAGGKVFEYGRGGQGWIELQSFLIPAWGVFRGNDDTFVAGNRIYGRTGNLWASQVLIPEAGEAWSAAVQRDTVAFGIPTHEQPPGAHNNDGSVRVYQRSGTTWNLQAVLALTPANQNLYFGQAVALDGDVLLASTGLYHFPGTVYIFRRNGATWTQEGSFGFPDAGDQLELALEGNTAVVSDSTKDRVGIFERSGTTWNLVQTFTYQNVLGVKVDLKGGVLTVGTEGAGTNVYVYVRNSSGWMLEQTVQGSFSAAHALSDNGRTLVVGDVDRRLARIYFTPPVPAPGSGWSDVDVGGVERAGPGSTSATGTSATVRGSGYDIWSLGDEFHYRTNSMTGDGAIIARVDSLTGSQAWAKAGLMFREDIAPASRNVMALVTNGGPVGMQARGAMGDYTTFTQGPWIGAPLWLMLARSGNLFAAYRSTDGNNWTPMGSTTIAMPATILVGLAVTSHDITTLATANYSNIELVGLPPPPNDPPAAPTNLQAGNQTSTAVALSWTDNSSDETGFEVQRSAGDGSAGFTAVTTTAAGATSYVDSPLTPDTQYTYRIRAVRSGTFSANSNTFTIRTLPNNNPGSGSADIGNVGVAGSTSASGNSVTLNAGGEDIWNTADGFRFYYRQWTGDGTLTAHVAALTNTHPWAKAGVMIRESLAPGSANAMMLLTADNACGLQTRPTTGAATDFISGAWLNAPYWVRLTRIGNLFSGYVSPDGVTWTPVGSRTIAMSSTVYVGLAASSHTTSALATASFDNVTLPDGPPPPPPPPGDWTKQVWGTATGSVTSSSTSVAITSTGEDIWNNADSGLYAWKTWNGDGVFTTRVDSFPAGHPWAKAGLMFRAASDAGAVNAFAALTAGVGAVFQVRSTANAASSMIVQDWTPGPGSWLKLQRQGNVFTAYYSIDDGTSWVLLGSQAITMPAAIQVGFAVSSHDGAANATANFSHFSTSP